MKTTVKLEDQYKADYDYSKCGEWSMTKEQANAIRLEAAKFREQGNEDAYDDCLKKIPLVPNIALMMIDMFGIDEIIADGYNLNDAYLIYGKEFLHNRKVKQHE